MLSAEEKELFKVLAYPYNPTRFEELIDSGVNVNILDIWHNTPLYYACYTGCNDKVIEKLLKAGADPNLKGKHNNSPLIALCHNLYRRDSIKLLIDKGADVNLTGENRTTPLLVACKEANYGTLDVIDLLIENGANVDHVDYANKTPLIIACERRFDLLLYKLLNAHADVNLKTPLFAAIKFSFKFVELLVEAGAKLDVVDYNNNTPLMVAATRCPPEVINYLLEHGAQDSINAVNNLNRTAVAVACYKKNMPAAIVLIEAGADVNIADVYGYSALDYAKQNNLTEIFSANRKGKLIKAVISRDEAQVQFCLKQGCDVNEIDKKGNTPLILACKNKLRNIAKILLEAKADVNLTPKYQTSPLKLAFRFKMYDLALLLIEKGANVTQNADFLLIACQHKNEDLIIALVNAGAPYNQKIKLSRQSQRMQFFLNSRYFGINVYIEQVINIFREDIDNLLTPRQREIRQILLQGFQQPESDFSTLASELLNLIFIQCLQ